MTSDAGFAAQEVLGAAQESTVDSELTREERWNIVWAAPCYQMIAGGKGSDY